MQHVLIVGTVVIAVVGLLLLYLVLILLLRCYDEQRQKRDEVEQKVAFEVGVEAREKRVLRSCHNSLFTVFVR